MSGIHATLFGTAPALAPSSGVSAARSAGDLPHQNIPYAIGRPSGAGRGRDQGQARYINLRGAGSRRCGDQKRHPIT